MTQDTSFSLFGVDFSIDPLTGIEVSNGIVGVEAGSDGSTAVNLLGIELAAVDLTTGVAVELAGSQLFGVDLTQGVAVDVADQVIDVDPTQGVASVEVAGTPVDVDLTQGVLFGVGEELLFADISEGVAVDTDSLAESGIEIPLTSDV